MNKNDIAPKHRDDYAKLMDGKRRMKREVALDERGDCLTYFSKDVAVNGEWIDGFLTVYFGARNSEIVGFKLKNLKAIAAIVRKGARNVKLSNLSLAQVLQRIDAAWKNNDGIASKRRFEDEHTITLLQRSDLGNISVGRQLAAAA
jgi:hypothetical protein